MARTRKELRQMGVPEDMTAEDVMALFSLPDDDDTMHCQRRLVSWFCDPCKVEVYQTRCLHCGKTKREAR